MQEPVESVPDAPGPASSDLRDVACKQCGYSLAGLSERGACPECGLPVERSLTDDRLINSAPAYLETLHRGVFLILAGIIAQILVVFGALFLGVALGMAGASSHAFSIAISVLSMAGTIAVAWGWWLFSAPDPAFTGRFDGSTARKVVRVTVIINAGIDVLSSVVEMAFPGAAAQPANAWLAVVFILSIVGLISWAVSFFASMLYVRWLAPRIPNFKASGRAKTLMWLGPLLFTVGALCVGLGPLIALVLYWNMLDWIRRDLKRIRAQQAMAV